MFTPTKLTINRDKIDFTVFYPWWHVMLEARSNEIRHEVIIPRLRVVYQRKYLMDEFCAAQWGSAAPSRCALRRAGAVFECSMRRGDAPALPLGALRRAGGAHRMLDAARGRACATFGRITSARRIG